MAFSVRCDFNRIQSYTEALKAWQSGIIFPKDRKLNNPALPRGLVNVRKRHMTIERAQEGEDIILRLYDHPVVTWHKDNSFTVVAYSTRSTIVFANHCTPLGIWVCSSMGQFAVHYNGRFYRVSDRTTFRQHDDGWKPDVITPWAVPFVNRERAKHAFKETNYKEFRLWLVTYVQMASPPIERGYISARNELIVSMLRERKWRELVTHHLRNTPDNWKNPNRMLSAVRHTIYVEYGCIEHKQVPFLGGRGVQL